MESGDKEGYSREVEMYWGSTLLLNRSKVSGGIGDWAKGNIVSWKITFREMEIWFVSKSRILYLCNQKDNQERQLHELEVQIYLYS